MHPNTRNLSNNTCILFFQRAPKKHRPQHYNVEKYSITTVWKSRSHTLWMLINSFLSTSSSHGIEDSQLQKKPKEITFLPSRQWYHLQFYVTFFKQKNKKCLIFWHTLFSIRHINIWITVISTINLLNTTKCVCYLIQFALTW